MIEFRIDLGTVNYPVMIGTGILKNFLVHIEKLRPTGSVVIIIDEVVAEIYKEYITAWRSENRIKIYILHGGKNNKSFYAAMKIFEYLDANNISRDSTIVAIGGGVVGDMAGYVASCWYRGVALIHMPTTLLSAVDSCVGGKTAINFRSTVNAVGTYHHPTGIFIDKDLILSLPKREISSGFGEIIKYSKIGASHISKILDDGNIEKLDQIDILIQYSLQEKERFVHDDVGEQANRLFLNFGHTIGHAIEFSTVYNGEETLRHGEGVGLGMLAIFRISEKLGFLDEIHIEKLRETLYKYGLPLSIKSDDYGIDRMNLVKRIIDLCFKDKKRTSNDLRLILTDRNFDPFIFKTSDKELIKHGVLEVVQ